MKPAHSNGSRQGPHPSSETLSLLRRGQLNSAEAAAINEHLKSCQTCQRAIELHDQNSGDSVSNQALSTTVAESPVSPTPGEPALDPLDPANVASPRDAVLDLPPELLHHSKFRIIRELGRGGMGTVYLAEHRLMERWVAVKVINKAQLGHTEALPRFLSEIKAAARLNHENIVRAHDAEQTGDFHMLVMEYVEGMSLNRLVKRTGPLPVAHCCDYVRQAALGLQYASEKGMTHRDIKPHNLMLTPEGTIKILDFGLARVRNDQAGNKGLTREGAFMGTPQYVAPEQAIDARNADTRADIYSLGCTFYYLLTGRPPFKKDADVNFVLAHLGEKVLPVNELRTDVPRDLSDVVARMLAKNPAERFQRPAEVAEALLPFISPNLKLVPKRPGYQFDQSPPHGAQMGPIVTGREQLGQGIAVQEQVADKGKAAQQGAWSRRKTLIGSGVGISILLMVTYGIIQVASRPQHGDEVINASNPDPIRIGVLHSRTGTMAISERPVVDAVLLAVDEINAQGGLLGRPVEAIQSDGESEDAIFASQAQKLIQEDHVCAIFGCWTSASRKAVVPIIEKHDHLLFYPVQYEGMEQSPNVIYLGPVPNQQILPALRWIVGFEGKKRWFLVGSDYIFPVTVNAVIRDEAKARDCTIVGEEYLILGSTDMGHVVKKIAETRPDLIVNTIDGDSNVAFFRALRQAGITPKQIPSMSFCVSIQELNVLGPRAISGDYSAAPYFHTLENANNKAFVRRFRDRYGAERVISSAMENAYVGVLLWAKAVQKAGTNDTPTIRETVRGLEIDTPQGSFVIDPKSQHTTQMARVALIDEAGELQEVYHSPRAILPEPFPAGRSREEWTALVEGLHKRWGGRWSNPGP